MEALMYTILYPDLESRLRDYRATATTPEVDVLMNRHSTYSIRPDHPMVMHASVHVQHLQREVEQIRLAAELARAADRRPRLLLPTFLAWLRARLPARSLFRRTRIEQTVPNAVPQIGPTQQ
jgi:hypothetical protein